MITKQMRKGLVWNMVQKLKNSEGKWIQTRESVSIQPRTSRPNSGLLACLPTISGSKKDPWICSGGRQAHFRRCAGRDVAVRAASRGVAGR